MTGVTLGFKWPNNPPAQGPVTLHHTVSSARIQQCFIQSQQLDSNGQSTFNLLTSNLLFDEVEKRLPEHRERLFPPTETLAMFVAQALSADRWLLPGTATITAGNGVRIDAIPWAVH